MSSKKTKTDKTTIVETPPAEAKTQTNPVNARKRKPKAEQVTETIHAGGGITVDVVETPSPTEKPKRVRKSRAKPKTEQSVPTVAETTPEPEGEQSTDPTTTVTEQPAPSPEPTTPAGGELLPPSQRVVTLTHAQHLAAKDWEAAGRPAWWVRIGKSDAVRFLSKDAGPGNTSLSITLDLDREQVRPGEVIHYGVGNVGKHRIRGEVVAPDYDTDRLTWLDPDVKDDTLTTQHVWRTACGRYRVIRQVSKLGMPAWFAALQGQQQFLNEVPLRSLPVGAAFAWNEGSGKLVSLNGDAKVEVRGGDGKTVTAHWSAETMVTPTKHYGPATLADAIAVCEAHFFTAGPRHSNAAEVIASAATQGLDVLPPPPAPKGKGAAKEPKQVKAASNGQPSTPRAPRVGVEPSNKEVVYKRWIADGKVVNVPALFALVKEAVKESTIRGWTGQWKHGNNLPACAK